MYQRIRFKVGQGRLLVGVLVVLLVRKSSPDFLTGCVKGSASLILLVLKYEKAMFGRDKLVLL